jgi:hypothetical protein
VCCFNPKGPGDHCAHPGQCNQGYVEISCNGPEDCAGGVCCATVDWQMQPPYTGIACAATCDGMNNLTLCDPMNPKCPNNTQCGMSQVLGQGYFVCFPN